MKKKIKLWSVVIAVFAVAILGGISIYIFDDYGLAVFFLSPFLLGFIPGFMVGFYENIGFKICMKLGMQALFFSLLALLVFALEGIICIAMASPLLLLATFLGAGAANFIHEIWMRPKPIGSIVFILASSMLFLGFDKLASPLTITPVTTQLNIDAPIEKVWENVIAFSHIPEPDNWFFETGIAYPINATIKGEGPGAVRYCNFTTGSFVEPITKWEEPYLLAFDVEKYPPPMIEYNPFWDVHPPHLNGYFKSHRGQFKLTPLENGTTLLEGTTWYSVDIQPEKYWQVWSEYIVHKIHYRVLEHIKHETEKKD